jgi:hypothetical protein
MADQIVRRILRARQRIPLIEETRDRIRARLEWEDSPRRREGLESRLASLEEALDLETAISGGDTDRLAELLEGDVIEVPTGSLTMEGQDGG